VADLVAEEILRGEGHNAELLADAIGNRILWEEVSTTGFASTGIVNICDHELYTEDVEEAWLYLKTIWSYTTLAINLNICLFTDIAIIGIDQQGAADFTIMQIMVKANCGRKSRTLSAYVIHSTAPELYKGDFNFSLLSSCRNTSSGSVISASASTVL
jgi:hypothetical protein